VNRSFKIAVTTMFLLFLAFAYPKDSHAIGSLSVSRVFAAEGDTVTVTLTLNSEDIHSGNLDIPFDPTAVELLETKRGDGNWLGNVNQTSDNMIHVNFASMAPFPQNTEICYLTFRVLELAPQTQIYLIPSNVRIYDIDGNEATGIFFTGGILWQDRLELSISEAAATPNQSAQVTVSMAGYSCPTGGNFYIEYDPSLLSPTAVESSANASHSQLIYNTDTPGKLKISYAGLSAIKEGPLCAISFRVISDTPAEASLTLSNVFMYDERGNSLSPEITHGCINILEPSDKAIEFWVRGGAIQDDGSAVASILLHGRDRTCGGSLTMMFDPSVEVSTLSGINCTYKVIEPGILRLSWASAQQYCDETVLATISFKNAVETPLVLTDVLLFDENGTMLSDVSVHQGTISANSSITANVRELTMKSEGKQLHIVAELNLSDILYHSDPIEAASVLLALYNNGQYKAIAHQPISFQDNGTAEVTVEIITSEAVDSYKILFVDQFHLPLPVGRDLSGQVPSTTAV